MGHETAPGYIFCDAQTNGGRDRCCRRVWTPQDHCWQHGGSRIQQLVERFLAGESIENIARTLLENRSLFERVQYIERLIREHVEGRR